MSRTHLAALVLTWSLVACVASPSGPQPMSPAERAALEGPDAPVAMPLRLLVPADGTVVPWSFPSLQLRWTDDWQGNAYRVRVLDARGGLLAEVFTGEHVARLSDDQWSRLRRAAGEGGGFRVEVVGAFVMPGGKVLRGPTRVTTDARFSGPSEHPTGTLLYGQRVRPVGAHVGPVSPHVRDVVARQVTMEGVSSYVLADLPGIRQMREALHAREGALPGLADSSDQRKAEPGAPEKPAPTPATTLPPNPLNADRDRLPDGHARLSADAWGSVDLSAFTRQPGVPTWSLLAGDVPDNCLGCHVVSADRRLAAVVTADPAALPSDWTTTQGSTYLVDLPRSRVVRALPGGTGLRFHPSDPDLVVYAATGNSTNMLDRASVLHADVHVLNLATGDDRPLPGASDPARCEFMPAWSPDGRTIAFSRTRPGEPCEGSTGWFEVATVPYPGVEGTVARPLEGASQPDASNLQPAWSPDGRWIVVYRTASGWFSRGTADLWVLPAAGGEARRLSVSTDALESVHQFSPDGRWLAFLSNRDRVDRPRGFVARFFDDGTTAPPVPLPGREAEAAHLDTLDWAR